ncbi:sensor histidine kinase [Paenibacillus sp. GCM10023252]|uniref:sensor histidine kinase n=1 Tax=Paenibacillus sp. GCM10023252 TaxID=3252649 RepID=UPI00360F7C6F
MRTLLLAFRDMRMWKKLVFSYVVVAFIPLLVLGIYSYANAKRSLERQLEMTTSDTVRQIVTEIRYRMSLQENPIKSIVFHPSIAQMMDSSTSLLTSYNLHKDMEPILYNYIYFGNDIKKIILYSDEWNRTDEELLRSSLLVKEESWYRATMSSTASQWWYDGNQLFVTRRVMDPISSRKVGLLYMQIDQKWLFDNLITSPKIPQGLLLTDNEGRELYQYEAQGTADTDGEPAASGTLRELNIPVPGTNWMLNYHVSAASLNEGADAILGATFALAFVCLLVIAGIVLLFSRHFVRGIHRLNGKMQLVEQGELEVYIGSTAKDEIGQLTNRFGRMLRRLNELIDDAYRSKIVLKEAEFKALQAQINPHFLYNTLSFINAKALRIGDEDISKLVTQLSRFYRTTLNKGRSLTTVRDELANVEAYLDIEQSRNDARYDIEFDIDPATLPHAMMNLLLQPIVENAVHHGLAEKRGERGRLTITSRLENGIVRFTIRDNGVGMDERTLAGLFTEVHNSYGVRNVHERIQIYYGLEYGLDIRSQLGQGTEVYVRFPYVNNPKLAANA